MKHYVFAAIFLLTIAQTVYGLDLDSANREAEEGVRYVYAYDPSGLRDYFVFEVSAGITFVDDNPWSKAKYIEFFSTLHRGYNRGRVTWRGLVDAFYSEKAANAIWYILQHYDEWYSKYGNH